MMIKEKNSPRYEMVDQLRGVAVVLMVIFHLSYNLRLFDFISYHSSQEWYWWGLPRLIVFLFLFTTGISLCLGHLPRLRLRAFSRRFLLISSCALLISVATFFLFPERWIYFGTLHCIALTSLLCLPARHYPKISFILGSALFFLHATQWLRLPWWQLPHPSMDYIAPFPWIGAVLLGVSSYHLGVHQFQISSNAITKLLSGLGRHSLIIYMLHQIPLFGIVWLLHKWLV